MNSCPYKGLASYGSSYHRPWVLAMGEESTKGPSYPGSASYLSKKGGYGAWTRGETKGCERFLSSSPCKMCSTIPTIKNCYH